MPNPPNDKDVKRAELLERVSDAVQEIKGNTDREVRTRIVLGKIQEYLSYTLSNDGLEGIIKQYPEFRQKGTMKGIFGKSELTPAEQLLHEACALRGDVVIKTEQGFKIQRMREADAQEQPKHKY